MNIQSLIGKSIIELKKSGINSASLDVQILLEHAINQSREFTYSHPEYLITNSQYSKFRGYIRRRKKGEPIAYIIGQKEFYGLKFFVNKKVLIPRPETEELVEKGITYLESRIRQEQNITVIDIGTGSGNIIVALARNILNSKFQILNSVAFYATDSSKQAIGVAKKNACLHDVDKEIKFYHSDLFSNRLLPKKFDLIVANLPYIPNNSTVKPFNNELSFEPQDAIFAPDNGSSTIKSFLDQAKNKINDGGVVLIELDPRNAKSLKIHAQKCFGKNWEVTVEKDLSAKNRFLRICPIYLR